jgi:hypothetical protein
VYPKNFISAVLSALSVSTAAVAALSPVRRAR